MNESLARLRVYLNIMSMLIAMLIVVIAIIDQPALYCYTGSASKSVKINRWEAAAIIEISLKISSLFMKGSSKGFVSIM